MNGIPTCAEAEDQHQQLSGRSKLFSSFGTDPLRQSREKQAQRESKYYARFISELFTDMTRNASMLRDAVLYFIKLSKELYQPYYRIFHYHEYANLVCIQVEIISNPTPLVPMLFERYFSRHLI